MSEQSHELLRSAARGIFEQLISKEGADGSGSGDAFYSEMGSLGWMGILVPEFWGGGEGRLADILVLVEESGRMGLWSDLVPTAITATTAVLFGGSDSLKNVLLPRLAAGEIVVGLALGDQTGLRSSNRMTCGAILATQNGNRVLRGQSLAQRAARANVLLVVARANTPSGSPAVVVVPTDLAGIHIDQLSHAGYLEQVTFEDVIVTDAEILGSGADGEVTEEIISALSLGVAALLLGIATGAASLTAAYAKSRDQFGISISGFQMVQRQCVEQVLDVESSRAILERAVMAFDAQTPARHREASIAASWISDSSMRVLERAHAVHGAIGFTYDYPLRRLTQLARDCQPIAGGSKSHRDRILRFLSSERSVHGVSA